MTVEECQAKVSSTEFVDWMVVLEKLDWEEHSKQDHYLAQIAAEIHNFAASFAKGGKACSPNDKLIKFQPSGTKKVETPQEQRVPITAPARPRLMRDPSDQSPKPGEVEIGPELMQDVKWQRTTAIAKSAWAGMVGVKNLTELSNG